ncbi:DUF5131 family protein [Thermoanaerobacterium sp. DL9XJH110]|uniref:DUF5131 family protein n=1 Tax=Thermoanaerobacterium sp. DL9XJH110 TaxID=3386643 RepID=UPI003BB66C37
MGQTKIEWATHVWNPISGCTPVSEGCENCYARRMAYRLRGRCGYPEDDPFRVTLHPEKLEEPLKWKKPKRVFVCSMGDLFHPAVPFTFLDKVFDTMLDANWHTYMILTKRPERMREYIESCCEAMDYVGGKFPFTNIWLGVTVENQQAANERIPILFQIPTAVRFVSCEPLLGPMDLSEWLKEVRYCERHGQLCDEGVTWDNNGQLLCKYCKRPVERFSLLNLVIVGGETGPGARPMHPDWARSLRDQCQAAGVTFFFKQWGEWMPHDGCWDEPHQKIIMAPDGEICEPYHGWGLDQRERGWEFMVRVGKKRAGRLLDGRTWDEIPEVDNG